MRLFTAVELPESLRRDLAAGAAPGIARIPGARAVPADRMHVTVRFLGDVDPGLVARLRGDLRSAAAPVAGGVAVVRFAWGERLPRRVRVYWAGIDDVGGALGRLEAAVTGVVTPLGVAPEGRPYRPHVTLARVRQERGARTSSLEAQAGSVAPTIWQGVDFPVRELVLFESKLGRDGPRYRALDRFPLASG